MSEAIMSDGAKSCSKPVEKNQCSFEDLVCIERPENHYDEKNQVCLVETVNLDYESKFLLAQKPEAPTTNKKKAIANQVKAFRKKTEKKVKEKKLEAHKKGKETKEPAKENKGVPTVLLASERKVLSTDSPPTGLPSAVPTMSGISHVIASILSSLGISALSYRDALPTACTHSREAKMSSAASTVASALVFVSPNSTITLNPIEIVARALEIQVHPLDPIYVSMVLAFASADVTRGNFVSQPSRAEVKTSFVEREGEIPSKQEKGGGELQKRSPLVDTLQGGVHPVSQMDRSGFFFIFLNDPVSNLETSVAVFIGYPVMAKTFREAQGLFNFTASSLATEHSRIEENSTSQSMENSTGGRGQGDQKGERSFSNSSSTFFASEDSSEKNPSDRNA